MSRRFAPSLLLMLAALVGGPVHAQGGASGEVISEVRFEGNRIVESERLAQEVQSRPGAPLDPELVEEDVRTLYRLGLFRDIVVERGTGPAGLVLTFVVSENPRIRQVLVRGADELDEDKVREVIETKPAELLDSEVVREDVRRIRTLYDSEGFTDARVSYEIEEAGESVDVVYQIQENEEVYIISIDFGGNEAFDDDDLRDVMTTSEKWWMSWLTDDGLYRKESLEGDVARLSALYLNYGYLDHRISEPELRFEEDGLHVHIDIDEGPAYTVSDLTIEGDKLGGLEGLEAGLATEVGEVLSRETLRQDIDALTQIYADRGYAFTRISPLTRMDREANTVDVILDVDKGEKVRFRRIEIQGNTKTRDKVIRRELRIREGGTYSGSRLRFSRQRLERLGFFENPGGVEFEERRTGEDDELDLVVKVKEGQTGTLSAGAGFSSVDSFLFNFRVSQYNFLGRGQTLVLNGDVGSRRQLVDFTFTEPYLFDIPLLASIRLFNQQQDFNDFDRSRTGGAFTLGYPLIEFIDGSLTYGYEQVKIDDISPNASRVLRDQEGTDRISSLTATLRRRTLNSRFDPTKGSDNSLSAQLAGTFLGGTSDFYKLEARTAWYVGLPWDLVWSVRGRLGYGRSLESDEDLPLFERYFVGGINSVRGFDSRSLGPKDPRTGDEIGGNKELVMTTELIFPIVPSFGLKGVVFFDAGEAYPEGKGYELDKLRTSAGFGFRWLSPLGPLRLEVGYPLVRREGDDSSALQFSVGGPI